MSKHKQLTTSIPYHAETNRGAVPQNLSRESTKTAHEIAKRDVSCTMEAILVWDHCTSCSMPPRRGAEHSAAVSFAAVIVAQSSRVRDTVWPESS